MINHILKFADDTKLFSQVSTYEDAEKLQKDISTLNEWTTEWAMLFNAQKCIHYGFDNKKYDYFIGNVCIETTREERHLLRVIITETLDVNKPCIKASNKANAMLGMINRALIVYI